MQEFKEEVEILFLDWQVHDQKDSRYAALLHLLKIWLWDANDDANSNVSTESSANGFPTGLMLRLIGMCRNVDRTIRATAFGAVVILVMRFESVLPKAITLAIAELYEDQRLKDDMIEVQKYFFTSVISLKIKKEIGNKIPELMRQQQTNRGKLGLEQMKRQVNEMVDDGVDMNQGSFIIMSQHEFFKNIRNWLIEFSPQNPVFNNKKRQGAISIFSNMTNLCDLDKYAMALTMTKLGGFEALIDSLPDNILESVENEDLEKELKKIDDKYAYMYTFQTFYRLFRLSPWRKQLYDPFQMGPFMSDFGLLAPFTTSDAFYENMAGLFSRHEFYAHASAYARIILNKKGNSEDMLQVLARCDLHLGLNDERLKCLLQLEKLKPDDLDIAAETGLCLINDRKFNEALERFFHMEVMEKGTHRSARAIAWCSLMTANYKRSERYYKKLLAWNGGPSWEDLLNAGHSAWLSGDPVRASQLYSQYLEKHKDNMQAFDCDAPELQRLGLSEDDINLMKGAVMG